MKKYLLVFLLFIAVTTVFAQKGSLRGTVETKGEPVPFAKVVLKETSFGALSDSLGNFEIKSIPYGTYTLKITATGYEILEQQLEVGANSQPLKLEVVDNELLLNEVVVTGTMRETVISKSPVKIEVLTQNFFKANPVNNVIEALQTVNGVQEQVNCGVCGTNDIHINGMEGPYTLVLIDGMPIVSGLSSVYGFNGIPTSMIDRVEIVKGPSSTLYGTEAVGGVVNIITKSAYKAPLIDFESRYSTHRELMTSLAISPQIGKQVYTSLSGDFYYNNYRMDFNEDGFTDIPLNKRISLFNKWQFDNKKGQKMFSLAGRYYNEDRFGGVMNWTHEFAGSDSVYGENIQTERIEVIGSVIFPTKRRNLRLDFSANNHRQNSYYGDVSYNAFQQIYFSNLIWEKKLGRRHYLISGLTSRYQIYRDNTPSNTDENTLVPGLFVQDEFDLTDQFTILAGGRLDYHTKHGVIFSPRLNLKKAFGSYTNLRFNYGTGFRQVHLFTEDHAFVSGARDVVILNELNPERSHNVTLNLNHTYNFLGYGNFDVDVFYTYFQNKIIPDYDYDPNLIVYDNLDGYGTTRGVSFAINHKFKIPLRIKTGVTLMDVFEMTEDSLGNPVKEQQFFAPKFSGTFGVSYEIRKIGLSINYNGRVMGPQRLPEFSDEWARPTTSPWFSIQNVQLTQKFKKSNLEVYTGIKNLLNYTQPSPLVDPANPYGDNFDTSYAYGPLQVRRFFFGIRWNLQRKKKEVKAGDELKTIPLGGE
ncbi:MAG: TonB-dependent receptor [Flavobacteriales bacterium]|nr:TonB-dependent receptor [Flavobacteriales bacterium]